MEFTGKMYTLVQGQSRIRHKKNGTEAIFHLWIEDASGITIVGHIEDKLVTYKAEEVEIS